MRGLRLVLLSALVISGCSGSKPAEEAVSRCGAINLAERPPLGQSGRWRSVPYSKQRNRFVRTHPQVFASTYLSGAKVYVGFTRDVCENLREFRQGLPDPWRVQAFEANFSYRRLRDAQKCVWRMVDDDWLGLSGVGTDVFRNQTEVMLEQDTEDRRSLIQSECGEDDSEDLFHFEEGKITAL